KRCIVDFVVGREATDGKARGGDVRRQPCGLYQGVVAGVGATQGITTDRDRPAGPDVLGAEYRGTGAAEGNAVTAQSSDLRRATQGVGKRCVVDFAVRGEPTDGEARSGNVRCQPRGLYQRVVAGVGATQGVPSDRNRPPGP